MQFAAQPLPTDDKDPAAEAEHQTAPDHRQEPTFHVPDFSDFKEAHAAKSNTELLRAYGVFTMCQIRPLVTHADTLISLSNKVLGQTLTNGIINQTFFGHFCAGKLCANDL